MKRPITFREADVVVGAIVAVFGGFVLFLSLQLRFYSANVPGPGFFPTLLAIALIVLGASLALTRLLKASSGVEKDGGVEKFELPSRRQAVRSLGLWIALLVAALLMANLGFLLTTLLLVAVIVFLFERRRGISAVLTTVLIPLLAWLLFAQLLQVRLPMGPLGG